MSATHTVTDHRPARFKELVIIINISRVTSITAPDAEQ